MGALRVSSQLKDDWVFEMEEGVAVLLLLRVEGVPGLLMRAGVLGRLTRVEGVPGLLSSEETIKSVKYNSH